MNILVARTPRYEWSRQYYQSTTTTTTTTERPLYRDSRPDNRYQHTVTVSRGTSTSDGKQLPGSYTWYNKTHHWSDNKPRGYDIDLDGPTPPPPEERTEDEEPAPLYDLKNPTKLEREHPLSILLWELLKHLILWFWHSLKLDMILIPFFIISINKKAFIFQFN